MISEYHFSYLSCQSCTAKIHCEKCQDEIADILVTNVPGVRSAEVNIPAQVMRIESDGADYDDIDDEMDAIGVFLG